MYDFSHKLLLQILCVKTYSHTLVGHDEVVTRWEMLVFIYMASMTYDKVMWMFDCH
jgi:hypothetical protein